MPRTGRKTDLRDDVDALTKTVNEMARTLSGVADIVSQRLRESEAAVLALGELGGRPPLRVVDVIIQPDQFGGEGKRMTVHWTPVGLILTENGQQHVTQSYVHQVAVMGPVGRFRG